MSVGLPLSGPMTADRLNKIRAVGREKRTKMSPVMTAMRNKPHMISTVVMMWPQRLLGVPMAVANGGERLHAEEERIDK